MKFRHHPPLDPTVYLSTTRHDAGRLVALTSTGEVRWSFETAASLRSASLIDARETIYLGTFAGPDSGTLHVLRKDGTEKGRYQTTFGMASRPHLGPRGNLYLRGSDDAHGGQGALYALREIDGPRVSVPSTTLQITAPALGGGEYTHREIAIRNEGTGPLTGRISLSGGSDAFSVVDGEGPYQVGGGERHRVTITYRPDDSSSHRATLQIEHDDPSRESPIAIGLHGLYRAEHDWWRVKPQWAGRSPYTGFDGPVEIEWRRSDLSMPFLGPDGTVHAVEGASTLRPVGADGPRGDAIEIGSQVVAPPAVGAKGTLFVPAKDTLYAVHPGGSLRWTLGASADLIADLIGTPLVGPDSLIYQTTSKGGVLAIRRQGSITRRFDEGWAPSRWLIQGDGSGRRILVPCGLHFRTLSTLVEAGQENERVAWGEVDDRCSSPCARHCLYVVQESDSRMRVFAIGGDRGGSWVFTPRGGPRVLALGPDSRLYVGSPHRFRSVVHAVDRNGQERWTVELPWANQITSMLVGASGTLYVAAYYQPDHTRIFHGGVVAIAPDGTKKWRIDLGNRVRGPLVIGPAGLVYVTVGHVLYALGPVSS